MSKFKVGDKVRIANPAFVRDYSLKGTVCTVTEIHDNYQRGNKYKLSINGISLNQYWLDKELELVASATFTKSDLKDGMVVEFRYNPGCPRQIVVGNLFIGLNENEYVRKCDYDDNLVCNIKDIKDKDLTIDRVYVINAYAIKDKNKYPLIKMDLIWERKEEPAYKEMTVEEIEKELGYKIKVIADKEDKHDKT